MRFVKINLFILVLLYTTLPQREAQACSMYKLSADGKTMVGCNEDAWRTTSNIWFENALESGQYGAAFTGSRQVSAGRTAPQSGMNEAGLVFSRLVAYHPIEENPFTDRLQIRDEVDYLSAILHQCATVEEVKEFIEKYDHSIFIDDVYIYVDKKGDYLLVEPYTLILGSDPYYVLSNFCPSITSNEQARNLERYRNGADLLSNSELSSSLSFCTTVSDTMHVCRGRNNDGTLLTSIWNTEDLLVNLYFYHSFDQTVQFDLREELAKGDHLLHVPDLFPINEDFERLTTYKTPFNTPVLRVLLFVLGLVLLFFCLLWTIAVIVDKKKNLSFGAVALISLMNSILCYYMFVLATNIYIYYFDAPYEHYHSALITASSYVPFLLLLILPLFGYWTLGKLKSKSLRNWTKALFAMNNMIYIALVMGFAYWGLYSFWV